MENVQLSNTYELGDKWLEREFRHVNFGDKRLITRLIKTTTLLESKASGSINQSCKSWREAKGAYRLFSNKKFNPEEIYSSHYKETGERIKDNKYVFSVQDTSNLDFDSHIKTKRLGSISKAYTKHKMGLMGTHYLDAYNGSITFRFIFSAVLGSCLPGRNRTRKIKKKIYFFYSRERKL